MRRIGLAVVLAVSLTLAPLAAEAQQAGKVYRVGVISAAPGPTPRTEAFREALRGLGWAEASNLIIEWRFSGGHPERVVAFVDDLVKLKMDAVVAITNPIIAALKRATQTIPIVMLSEDAVRAGLVSSLARPGGNLTGLSGMTVEIGAKRLELLKDALPRLARVGIVFNPGNAAQVLNIRELRAGGEMLGVSLHFGEWRTAADIEPVFAALQQARIDAVVGFADPLTFTNRNAIIGLALKHRLPLMFELREFVDAGALMAYGVNLTWAYQRAAVYVDRIFRGARPADLPVEQPTKFELVINLKTAKVLGLTIPPSLLGRADQLIE